MKTFGITDGPQHEAQERFDRLSRCGVKQQFRHHWKIDATEADITCPKCIRLRAKGQFRAWRSS